MLALILALAVTTQKPTTLDDGWVEKRLAGDTRCAPVFASAEEFKLQVLVTEFAPGKDGKPTLVRHGFRVDREYVYPASAIKLLGAVAALEKLNDLRTKEPRLSETTPLRWWPDSGDRKATGGKNDATVDGPKDGADKKDEAARKKLGSGDPDASGHEEKDATNLDGGTITLRHEIRKVFLVSDNAAFNRLFEFTGQKELNTRMRDAGLPSVRMIHRLSTATTEAQNLRTPRIDMLLGDESVTIPERRSDFDVGPNKAKGLKLGKGVADGSKIVDGPMDCSRKNSISLVDLQDALIKVVRRDVDLGTPAFTITDAQAAELARTMAEYPNDSTNPRYSRGQYPDDYGKFLLPGLLKVAPKEAWRIENKVGRAYGFSIENAHVVHVPSGKSLIVTVALYTNADQILNDGVYEYETIADPFLAGVGEQIGRMLAN